MPLRLILRQHKELADWAEPKLAPVLAMLYPQNRGFAARHRLHWPPAYCIVVQEMDGGAYTAGTNVRQ